LGVLVFNGSWGSSFSSHLHAYHTQLNIFSLKEIALSAFFPTLLKYPTVSRFQTTRTIRGRLLVTVQFPQARGDRACLQEGRGVGWFSRHNTRVPLEGYRDHVIQQGQTSVQEV
jgi:hypothetical protein